MLTAPGPRRYERHVQEDPECRPAFPGARIGRSVRFDPQSTSILPWRILPMAGKNGDVTVEAVMPGK